MVRAATVALGAAIVCASALAGAPPAEARTIPPLVTPSDGGGAWSDAERAALRSKLATAFASAAAIRGAHVGFYAVDARDGSPLYARTPDDEYMPASTLKLLVGSVALARLGTQFRFHSQAFVTGSLTDGVQDGPLVLRGGGDPFLRSADLADLAGAVAAAGVKRIAGGVRIDSSYFDARPYPPGWVWDDFPFYYAPVVSAASLEENVVHLTVSSGERTGDPAPVTANPLGAAAFAGADGCRPGRTVRVIPRTATAAPGEESTVDVDRLPGDCIEVVGKVPLGGKDTVDGAVPSAEAYAWQTLDAALRARGIDVGSYAEGTDPFPEEHRFAGSPPGSQQRVIWSHDSEPMPKLLADMWYPSDNLLAELLLKSLGVARSGVPGTTENGAALELEYLRSIGVDPKTATLRDGSGLSIYDRITPRDLVAVLQSDWNGPNRGIVLDALPVAGVRGTLREEFVDTRAAGRAFVKTGSMSHVRGLAGFLSTRRHGTVTFALMVDDWNGVASGLDAFRGALLDALVDA
jgi:D-alanyl-D-alanine carboxypeptidase/D-alanyl-D-alanine-endopeptidase (penicillin-binding protein 4)